MLGSSPPSFILMVQGFFKRWLCSHCPTLELDNQPGHRFTFHSLDSQNFPWDKTTHSGMTQQCLLLIGRQDDRDTAIFIKRFGSIFKNFPI